jgi:hypothetical protein
MLSNKRFKRRCKQRRHCAPRFSAFGVLRERRARNSTGREVRCMPTLNDFALVLIVCLQLKATLAALDADLEDLEESVK